MFDRQDVVELGGCDRPAVQNQRRKPKGWATSFCRVGKVASGDQAQAGG